ncbi:MAG: hypothetical protein ABIP48_24620 [Planctomycetota bacterium]
MSEPSHFPPADRLTEVAEVIDRLCEEVLSRCTRVPGNEKSRPELLGWEGLGRVLLSGKFRLAAIPLVQRLVSLLYLHRDVTNDAAGIELVPAGDEDLIAFHLSGWSADLQDLLFALRDVLNAVNWYFVMFPHTPDTPIPFTPPRYRPASYLGADFPTEHYETLQYVANELRRMVGAEQPPEEMGVEVSESAPTKVEPKPKQQADSRKRSWTQPELDKAIEDYKARRSSDYHELIGRVERGDNGAKKAAREMFSRKAIGEALGVKRGSYAMISNSPAWQAMADALGLKRKRESTVPKREKIGLDMAVEAKGEADHAIRRRSIRMLEENLPLKAVEEAKKDLASGETTDDDIPELILLYGKQQADDKSKKVLPEG